MFVYQISLARALYIQKKLYVTFCIVCVCIKRKERKAKENWAGKYLYCIIKSAFLLPI